MGDLAKSLFLGILQGLTEFLPVSSSGHLVVLLGITGWEKAKVLPLIICLHLATSLAVAVYFRREILSMAGGLFGGRGEVARDGRRLAGLIVAGSLPTAFIGLLFKDFLEGLFAAPRFTAFGLVVTGLALWASEIAARRRTGGAVTWGTATAIGLAQGIAIAPGISRSGATISAALALGVARAEAFSFSFMLSLPATLGAALLEAGDLGKFTPRDILLAVVGMSAAFAVGYASLGLLSRWVMRGKLSYFSFYCWALAGVILAAL